MEYKDKNLRRKKEVPFVTPAKNLPEEEFLYKSKPLLPTPAERRKANLLKKVEEEYSG